MKVSLNWSGGMQFDGFTEAEQKVSMDAKAPLGRGAAPTPKELVAAGLAGCTAMDVAALLKKHRQEPQSLKVEVDIETSVGVHPAVFTKATILYSASGPVSKDVLLESVRLSQTQYCGVSAMLAKAFPIEYKVRLNDEEIGSGRAAFTEVR